MSATPLGVLLPSFTTSGWKKYTTTPGLTPVMILHIYSGDVAHLTLLGAVVLNIRLPLSVYFVGVYYGNIVGVSYKIILTEHTEEFRDEVEHKNVTIYLYSYNHTYRGRSKDIYNLHRRTTTYFKYLLCRICNFIFLPSSYDTLSS